ncbi:MAG: isoprenylcysteine carboxylmethyltransferase family protein [Candidatus Paceibacterota bacterium]|jgi:protein-S-isoprenylcysteine O-methyltransferase Ste14
MSSASGYGMWGLVVLNVAIFLIFAFSFTHPKTKRDWRSFGAFSAFIVALFTEMYGFPLTIYFLSGWLTKWVPGLDPFTHNSGHILEDLFGWGGDPHFGPFHIASYILIFYGFSLLAKSWKVLYASQREHTLATTGPYARIRHPQYVGFVTIMFGFLLQWPTILTVIMFPILIWVYTRLAYREEREMQKEFGDVYKKYYEQVPAFIPRLKK